MKEGIDSGFSEVHWYEGMFLLPHHYQTARRRDAQLNYEKTMSVTPWWWGVADLQINSIALSGNRIKVDRGVIRLKDGTWLNIPDNAYAEEKSFEDDLKIRTTKSLNP